MATAASKCPFSATTVRFIKYGIDADLEFIPETGSTPQRCLFRYRFENPNPFSARTNAIRMVRRIKSILDKDLPDSEIKYQYEDIKLWLEYEIAYPYSEKVPEKKQIFLLDGKIGTRDDVLSRLSSEEFLLDIMGFTFVRGDISGDDEKEYSELVDELFDGLFVIGVDLTCQ